MGRDPTDGRLLSLGLHCRIPSPKVRPCLNKVVTQTREFPNPPLAVGRPVLLVGQPNVGKSALFGALTGRHATVSNYPGTTVTVSRGSFEAEPNTRLELIDTPGAYSLMPVTDEERVARNALFQVPAAAVLHWSKP